MYFSESQPTLCCVCYCFDIYPTLKLLFETHHSIHWRAWYIDTPYSWTVLDNQTLLYLEVLGCQVKQGHNRVVKHASLVLQSQLQCLLNTCTNRIISLQPLLLIHRTKLTANHRFPACFNYCTKCDKKCRFPVALIL